MSIQVFGLPVSRGVAIGRAVLVASSRVDVAHYFVDADSVPDEITRLRHARDVVVNEIDVLKRELPADAPPEVARVSPLEASTRYLAHLRQAWQRGL